MKFITFCISVLKVEEMRRKKEAQLRQYVFFQLRVHLKSGSDLVAMDKNGLSIIFFYLCLFSL